jgi:hypothetical protein
MALCHYQSKNAVAFGEIDHVIWQEGIDHPEIDLRPVAGTTISAEVSRSHYLWHFEYIAIVILGTLAFLLPSITSLFPSTSRPLRQTSWGIQEDHQTFQTPDFHDCTD